METYIVLRVICSKTSYASISLMSLFQVPSPTLRDCFIQYRMTTLNSISTSLFCMLSSILVSRGFEECKTLDRRPSAVWGMTTTWEPRSVILEYLVMPRPRGERENVIKMILRTLAPINFGPEKGTGRAWGKEEKRWRLKEALARWDFFKLNSGPGTVPAKMGKAPSRVYSFQIEKNSMKFIFSATYIGEGWWYYKSRRCGAYSKSLVVKGY